MKISLYAFLYIITINQLVAIFNSNFEAYFLENLKFSNLGKVRPLP